MAELVSYARANPGKLNAGDSGKGGATFYAITMLNRLANLDIAEISFKGSAEDMVSLLGGEIQMMFSTQSTHQPQLKAGRVKLLAVTTAKRIPFLPDVPTIAEAANLPGYDSPGTWYFMMAPSGTPAPVLDKINGDVRAIMGTPEMTDRFRQLGAVVITGTPQELFDRIARENTAHLTLNASVKKP